MLIIASVEVSLVLRLYALYGSSTRGVSCLLYMRFRYDQCSSFDSISANFSIHGVAW